MDRPQAIERLRRAIDEYLIQGLETTLEFGRYVLDHEAFVSGRFDTGFVGAHFDAERFEAYRSDARAAQDWGAAAAALAAAAPTPSGTSDTSTNGRNGAWKQRFAD